MIRKISSHLILPISGIPLKLGKIVCDINGNILEVIETNGRYREEPFLEFYDGIIVPGFLSILDEDDYAIFNKLKDRQHADHAKHLEQLIQEVTLDMAIYLGCDRVHGSLEVNKKPGINLISGIDFPSMKLTRQSQLKILIPR
jgi:hypothetical protein